MTFEINIWVIRLIQCLGMGIVIGLAVLGVLFLIFMKDWKMWK